MRADPTHLPGLTLRQIQYFVVLARERSFTQAAHSLSISQPALTAAIRQVEFLLGGLLFDRKSHRLALTDAGAIILPFAQRLLNHSLGTFDDMAKTMVNGKQTVRIGMIPSVSDRLFPELKRLSEKHPNLQFRLDDLPNSDLIEAVEKGLIDLAIGVHEKETVSTTLDFLDLFEDEIVAVTHVDDPLSKTSALTWSRLAGHPLAVFIRGNVNESLLRTAVEQHLTLAPAYRMAYTEPIYALVRNRMAVAIMPMLYTASLHDPYLQVIRLTNPRVTRTISMVTHKDEARSPQVLLCRKWLADHLATPSHKDK